MSEVLYNRVDAEELRRNWLARVEQVVAQIEQWAASEGWSTARTARTVKERLLGTYEAPVLRVRLADGEVHVIPVAYSVLGADGRIDIEAFPTLNRVKLVARGDHWEIYTDSNVPLRQPWSAPTFAQLARDLLA